MEKALPVYSERLTMRRFTMEDAEALYAYKRLPETVRYQFWRPKTMGEVERFLADMQSVEPGAPGAWLQLAVCLKQSGELIGDVGAHFSPEGASSVEIGYTIAPGRQGGGYATEAVRALVTWLFAMLGAHRVSASVDPRNGPSARVLEKLGFRREAHFRKSVFMDGLWRDDWVYAVLEEEWK